MVVTIVAVRVHVVRPVHGLGLVLGRRAQRIAEIAAPIHQTYKSTMAGPEVVLDHTVAAGQELRPRLAHVPDLVARIGLIPGKYFI